MGLNKKQHDSIYPELVSNQDGEYCNWCGLTKEQLIQSRKSDPVLLIDHKDNNSSNNAWTNLQLLCRSCNRLKNRYDPPRRNPTPEMEKGIRNMKLARRYVVGKMLEIEGGSFKKLEFYTLVDDIAEYLDCSQQSVKNYLAKMTSKEHGAYEWEDGKDGHTYLVPK